MQKDIAIALVLANESRNISTRHRALIFAGLAYPAAHRYIYGSEPSNIERVITRLPQHKTLGGRDCPAFLINLDQYADNLLTSDHFIHTFVGDKI